MIAAARWMWRELTRPRGVGRHRYYRVGRQSRSGVALLMVITSIMLITIVAGEISFGARVRLDLSAHQRDEAKAEALAYTGVQIYRLVLVASKGLGQSAGSFMAMLGMPADALWQMIPFLNTGMMRMLLVSGDDLEQEDVAAYQAEGLTEAQIAESREEGVSTSKRNFLDFDGDFFAEVTDEESRIYVGKFTATSHAELMEDPNAMRLFALMSGESNDQFFYDSGIERWELIGDLADWTDPDDSRLYQGGVEDLVYQRLEDPYFPKNAPVDTMQELRLINGWHRDDVWERFGDKITVYGGGRVNVNTATSDVMMALLRTYVTPNSDAYLETLYREVQAYMALASYPNGAAFASHLESLGANVDPNMKTAITTESTVFRIHSTGQVGDAVVSVTCIIDFNSSRLGRIVYWRVE